MQNERQNNRKWYVLTTKPRAEKQVSRRLTESGIEHFLPLQRRLRFWKDRKKWVEIPLFNSYIFVKIEERLRSKIFAVGGLVKYVSFGGQIAVLAEQEIDRIKCLCRFSGIVSIEQGNLTIGAEVEVMEGHFAGFRGQLLQIEGKNKLKLSIAGLGCFATVEIEKKFVRKI